MKVKPEIYAKSLLAALKAGRNNPPAGGEIAKNFWQVLEKNKQRKSLPAIFSALEREFAKSEGKVLVEVESNRKLSTEEIDKLEKFSEKKLGKKPMLKIFVKPETIGVVLKYEGTILDATLETKLDRLKQKLTTKNG